MTLNPWEAASHNLLPQNQMLHPLLLPTDHDIQAEVEKHKESIDTFQQKCLLICCVCSIIKL